ncbi:class I SAM-dependent methyltransferase [Lutibacter sp.]
MNQNIKNKKEPDANYWEDVWKTVKLPQEIKKEKISEIHNILIKYLPSGKHSVLEVGCAPGKWLAYFFNAFKYSIYGIEYAPIAYEKTIENLKTLNIPNNLFNANFMEFEHEPFDVVFSAGFVEHFKEVLPVFQKKVDLCKINGGYIVTMIPSMQGFNWWISKVFRPEVAKVHFPMNKKELLNYHEKLGVKTLYCDYLGSYQIAPPMDKNDFSKKHPYISAIINFPFKAWNKVINFIFQKLKINPKSGLISSGVIYVGKV